jgi:hypothetical protein
METIRVAIYYGLQRGWLVMQYDVVTAFLYGPLEEEIYMEIPAGMAGASGATVCRRLKSLYGLKQAPKV